jgi:DNA-binding transcriptional ArsR family regulator
MGVYRNTGLDAVLGAVADSTRRAIIARLAASDARVTEIAAGFPISLNSVSKHIRMLERAGLVEREVIGRDHYLSLNAKPLAEAADWIDEYRRFWTGKLAALEDFIKHKHQTTGKRKKR